MLTPDEINFITYWQNNRAKQKKITSQLMIGLPTGLLFGLPILLNLFLEWNNQIQVITRGQLYILVIAVAIITSFISVFTVKHKWDLREQHYRELLVKQKKEVTQN
jgi:hypothetical protein